MPRPAPAAPPDSPDDSPPPVPPELARGTVVPIVLSLLAERPRYGYEIVKVVDARSGGRLRWREGTLYPTLHALEADGLLRAEWRPADADPPALARRGGAAKPPGRSRKYYALTAAGRRAAAERASGWRDFADAVNSVLAGDPARKAVTP